MRVSVVTQRWMFDPDYLGQLGFSYYGIGRGLGIEGFPKPLDTGYPYR
jgi:hypothetical protein